MSNVKNKADKTKYVKKNIKKRGGTNTNTKLNELSKPKYTDEQTFIKFKEKLETLLRDKEIANTLPQNKLNAIIKYYNSKNNTGGLDFILKFYMKFILFSKIERKWESIFIYLTLYKFNKHLNNEKNEKILSDIVQNKEILKYLYYSLYSKNEIITTTNHSIFTVKEPVAFNKVIQDLYFKGKNILNLYKNYMFKTDFFNSESKSTINIIRSLKENYILDILLGSLLDNEMRIICVTKKGTFYGQTPYVEIENKKGFLFYHFDIIENFDKHHKIDNKSLSEYYNRPILQLESKSIDYDMYICEHWYGKITCNNYQHMIPTDIQFIFDPLLKNDTFNLTFKDINKKLLNKIIGTDSFGIKRDGDSDPGGKNINYIKKIKIEDFKAIMRSPKEKNVIDFSHNQTVVDTIWESIFG